MTDLLDALLADLKAEGDQLWNTVSGLDEAAWETSTPAAGWDIAHQIAHLLWTDEVAVLAATDREMWDLVVLQALGDPDGYVDTAARRGGPARSGGVAGPMGFRPGGARTALRDFPEGQKIAWFGPPMAPASMATARFMETWAHGLDVYHALGIDPEPTDRIRHVAHLGVRTRNYAFAVARARPADRGVPRRAHRAVGRDVGVGPGGRRAERDRFGVRLLPAGHPAHPPRGHRPGRGRRGRRSVARDRAGLRGTLR